MICVTLISQIDELKALHSVNNFDNPTLQWESKIWDLKID